MFMWRTKSNWHRNQCSAHHLQRRVDNAPRISQEKRRPYKGLDRSEIMEETCAGGFLQWSRRTKQNHPRLRPLSHWSGASLGRFRSGEYTSPKAPLPIEINGQRRFADAFNPFLAVKRPASSQKKKRDVIKNSGALPPTPSPVWKCHKAHLKKPQN